jgi:phosphate transport system protein
MRHFGLELEELNQSLLQMGGLVESSLRRAVQSVVDREKEAAKQVMRDEERINQMQLEIDATTTRLLALNQPVARDLRMLTAILKINTDLERMGDLAVNIAERAISLSNRPRLKAMVDIPKMASLVESMLLKSLDAFVKADAELARSVLPADNEVDALRDAVYTELVALMQREPMVVPGAVDLMFVARNLERIADHATNIAEDVIFLVKGEDVRHHHSANRSEVEAI